MPNPGKIALWLLLIALALTGLADIAKIIAGLTQ
jgi:hypothetical protein